MSIIDISHWNSTINWDKVKKDGIEAVYIKCSNGSHNTDNQYDFNNKEARRVGIKVGAYHFMLSSQNPDEQAENFLAHKGIIDLLPVLDMEWDFKNNVDQWKLVSMEDRIAMVGRFLAKVQGALQTKVMIYTNKYWWARMFESNREWKDIIFNENPLWLADYSTLTDNNLKCPPWQDFTMRQYTERGIVDGIKGLVDMNRFSSGKSISNILI